MQMTFFIAAIMVAMAAFALAIWARALISKAMVLVLQSEATRVRADLATERAILSVDKLINL